MFDVLTKRTWGTFCLSALLWATATFAYADDNGSSQSIQFDPIALFRLVPNLTAATRVHDAIYQAKGIGNTNMVITEEGNVVIDTSLAQFAPHHKRKLQAIDSGPIKYIILTHAHADHTGGLAIWKEEATKVVTHKSCTEFLNYQTRLSRFFAVRNAAQFNLPRIASRLNASRSKIDADIVFDEEFQFELGGVRFELHHTPGETYDHVSVWIPQYKAAFVGDNYYRAFPNLYTLRGTRPRWALDYVASLNKVLSWQPELLISGHSDPVIGQEEITKALTRFRDAILFVHDATVQGMNEGKDVHTLMREIRLPPELSLDEKYGTVVWGVRGIYEGYVGWFDGNPSSMYGIPASEAYPEIVALAGGPDAVAQRAETMIRDGYLVQGLHLSDIALGGDPNNVPALEARLGAFNALEQQCKNTIERGWLRHGIRTTQKRLDSVAEKVGNGGAE